MSVDAFLRRCHSEARRAEEAHSHRAQLLTVAEIPRACRRLE
jgi:hypothetical protein